MSILVRNSQAILFYQFTRYRVIQDLFLVPPANIPEIFNLKTSMPLEDARSYILPRKTDGKADILAFLIRVYESSFARSTRISDMKIESDVRSRLANFFLNASGEAPSSSARSEIVLI